ncbi:class I SAM-dependent methyltransferase [Echinicola sediminis]
MKKNRYTLSELVHNTRAAEVIVPLILKVVQPHSILDVGCGIGTWMNTFLKHGIQDVCGVDGDYVDRSLLKKYIPLGNFIPQDLEKAFDLQRKFDLVISFEVAEHLKASAAKCFVESLTKHGDLILFSAAVPGQGGQNHVNEQWLSYWSELFAGKGYTAYEMIRPLIWEDKNIDVWYRQNMVLFSSKNLNLPEVNVKDMILPDLWEQKISRIQSMDHQLKRIREGKVGMGFYLKGIIKSLKYFGRKQK